MDPLIAVGGIDVPSENVMPLESSIEQVCRDHGFSTAEEFKWSPGRGLPMRERLTGDARAAFFDAVLLKAREMRVGATVVIEDSTCRTAVDESQSHEADATLLFLERVTARCTSANTEGVVLVDRPGGGRGNEDKFMANTLDSIQSSAGYIRPDRLALNVICTSSTFIRLLQLADLVTSCTLAFVSGEDQFAPKTFPAVRVLLNSHLACGGVGLKLHPDMKYLNLYHWLLGDDCIWRGNSGFPLPMAGKPYFRGPTKW